MKSSLTQVIHPSLVLLFQSLNQSRKSALSHSRFQYHAFYARIKYLVCPNAYCVKSSMLKIPGCPTACGSILQYTSWHAFRTTLTHNPLHSRRCVTSTEQLWEHKQMAAHWQTAEGQCSRCNIILKWYVPTVCILHAAVRTKRKSKWFEMQPKCPLDWACPVVGPSLWETVFHLI